MEPTIKDVANLAGVSPATVSRALGFPDMVKPATRERVQAVVESVGYISNKAARGLITGKMGNIAILVPDLTNPFFPGIVKGVQRQASKSNYSVFIADTEDSGSELNLARNLAQQVDGLILCSSQLPDEAISALSEHADIVLMNRTVPGAASVTFDNRDCMHQAVAHLTALGHRKIAWIGGPLTSWSNGVRSAAVHEEALAAGVELTDVGNFPPRFEGGVFAADLVLASGATAVIAYNDLMALGAISRFTARGTKVPGEMSVVGIDGSLMGQISSPSLTSVALPLERAGRSCVDILLATNINQGEQAPRHLVMPAQLMVRNSSGVAPGAA